MKRFTKKEWILLVLGVVLGVLTAVFVWVHLYTVPATRWDYQQLEQQAVDIQKNPELILEKDCKIVVEGETITVTFKNKKCKVIAKYDKNFEQMVITESDDHWLWPIALMVALGTGLLVGVMGPVVLAGLVSVICLVVPRKHEKKKAKKQ